MTGPSKPTRGMLIRRVITSLALIGILLGAGFVVMRTLILTAPEPDKLDAEDVATVVRVMEARPTTWTEPLRGYGRARALKTSVIASEVSGLVTWVAPGLETGLPVRAGEELLRIDESDATQALLNAQAAVDVTDADLASARIRLDGIDRRLVLVKEELEVARRELARVEGLARGSAATESALDAERLQVNRREQVLAELEQNREAAVKAVVAAAARVVASGASLRRAESDLARTHVTAPWDGVVRGRDVEVGVRVGPGSPLFSVVDPRRVEIPISLPASNYRDVRPGATVQLSEPGAQAAAWSGVIARIAPEVDALDRTFRAFAEVTAGPGQPVLPPGAFVMARLDGQTHENVIVIPRTSVLGRAVFLAEPAGEHLARVHRIEPEFARLLGDVALISGGVPLGAHIVLTNVEELAEGTLVGLVVEESDALPVGAGAEGNGR